MKKAALLMMAAMTLTGCTKGDNSMGETLVEKLYVTIGEVTHSVTLEDNVATRSMVAALRTGDITYTAHDYGGFEKVGAPGQSFPSDDHRIGTSAGDLVLYEGDNVCIFYGSNSWSYTRIGKFDNLSADEVRRFVKAGQGKVTVTLSLQPIYKNPTKKTSL